MLVSKGSELIAHHESASPNRERRSSQRQLGPVSSVTSYVLVESPTIRTCRMTFLVKCTHQFGRYFTVPASKARTTGVRKRSSFVKERFVHPTDNRTRHPSASDK